MALVIEYTGPFVEAFEALDSVLKNDVRTRIEEFRNLSNHRRLRVHKLHGRLAKYYGFSVDYRYRIVFSYPAKGIARLHAVGDHDIYK